MAIDPILGDTSLLPAAARNEVKGNLALSRLRYIQRHCDAATQAKIRGALSPTARAVLDTPPAAFAWVPLTPLTEIDRAIVTHVMGGDVTCMREFGSEIAQVDLSTVYRLFLRIAMTPARGFKRLPSIYGEYFRCGSFGADLKDKQNGELALKENVLPYYLCAHGIVGWIEAALRLTGANTVDITHTACRHRGKPECRYDVRWDEAALALDRTA